MPTYKLTYFNSTGLGEPTRFLLSYCGIDFEDNRIVFENWPQIRLNMPMGEMPVLEIDGKMYHQTRAYGRYLAKKHNLHGSDDMQRIEVDTAVDDIDDWRVAIVPFLQEQDEPTKAMLKVPAVKKTEFFLGKFEERVKKNGGYFVGNKISWPDIYFSAITEPLFYFLGKEVHEGLYPNLQKLIDSVRSEPKIKAYLEKRPKTLF